MNALLLLFRMKAKGAFRGWLSSFKTLEGAFRGIFTILFIGVLFVPLFAFRVSGVIEVPAEFMARSEYGIQNFFPMLVGLLLVASLAKPNSGQSLNFQPAEIDFLFAAPFSRNDLLIYKLLGIFTSSWAVCLALTCPMAAFLFFPEGNFAFALLRLILATGLAILLQRLIFVWSGLIRKSVLIRLITPFRKIALATIAAIGLVSLISIRDKLHVDIIDDPQKATAALRSLVDTQGFQLAVAPFRMFSNLVLSKSILETTVWASFCIAANGLAVFLIMKTDKNFLETELHYSQLRAEALKKSVSLENSFVSSGDQKSLPMLPFMGGIGPIMWRQLQTFYRMKQSLIVQVILYFIIFTVVILIEPKDNIATIRFAMVVFVLAMITFFGALAMPMGFHTDVKLIEQFKSLPFSRNRIVLGQILGPVLILGMVQYATIAIFMFVALDVLVYWLIAALFAPLVSTVLLCLVNSLALAYPKRPNDGVVNELENVGHILVFVFLLFFVGTLIFGAMSSLGAAVYFLTKNLSVVVAATWFVMLVSSIVGIWITGWSFERFDVSKHRM